MARVTNERLNYVSGLIDEALEGKRKAQRAIQDEIDNIYVEESHSTSDFPAAFQAVSNRALLGQYALTPNGWSEYARAYDVNNLKPTSFYSFWPDYSNLPEQTGGKARVDGGLPRVPELTEFPTFSFAAAEQSINVRKYGARVNFSFEMLLNDEWAVLETLPVDLAQLAINTEDIVATEILTGTTGPNTTTFSATAIDGTGDNRIAGNPALTIDSLNDAIASIRNRRYKGNPVTVSQFALVVPPALERLARQIIGITSLQVTDVNGTYDIASPISGVTVVVNPWLGIVGSGYADVDTTWYLVPINSNGIRPAILLSKIRGRGNPELRIATQGGAYLGGGPVPGLEGSFETDDIQFRVKHYVGAAAIATETMAVSKGTNAAW
jgi:hypothetical protein